MEAKWNSRKFWVAMGAFLIGTGLLVFGFIDMMTWKWMSGITVGSYLGAQGITDAVAALKQ